MDGAGIGTVRTRVLDLFAVEAVPLRALGLSLLAMAAAVGAAALWPQLLVDREILAGGLALIPALLLAHYRGWPMVSVLLGLGLVALTAAHFLNFYDGDFLRGPFLILFVVAPYIAIALGAGWFGELRQYKTELRAAQLQLIQSEKLDSLGCLSAGIAHELKNPLMMMLTGVRILAKRPAAADEQTRQLLQDMTDAVERADKIIAGLLNYSRGGGLDMVPTDLNATIEQSLMLVRHELANARIRVVKNLDESLPMVPLDQFKIEQVFVNLFTNAIHAIDGDGDIRITTSLERLPRGPNVGYRKTDRYVPGERVAMVQIEDSGPGIPEAHLKKVFDPFFTTKPTGHGTGLGLSVSRQIVDMHGGVLDLANRETGGARATLILKLDTNGAAV